MKTDITQIIELIVTLICSVLTAFVLPIIKDRLSQSKREKLKFWVDTAVKAAEQIYGEKAGQQKKDYVVSFLLSKGIVFDIDEVTALIESSVYTRLNSDKELIAYQLLADGFRGAYRQIPSDF